jgi:hypothetical protein
VGDKAEGETAGPGISKRLDTRYRVGGFDIFVVRSRITRALYPFYIEGGNDHRRTF